MSDDRTGRELTPRPDEEPSAVTPREAGLPTTAPVERFSAGQQAHTVGLTEERAAQIVRSSGNARMVAGVGVVAGSSPEAELVETQLKLQAMLAAIIRP